MSTPILPFAVWASGTNQNSIPANDNAMRAEIFQRDVNNATTAQPGSPSDGDTYIIQSTHTGSQWSGFTPKDLAIYKGGTWYAFAPVEGCRVTSGSSILVYDGGAWTTISGGGGSSATYPSLLINGIFNINQRQKSGTVTLTAGQYGHDRWKAGASGATYTFASSGGITTLTITAGSLIQVVEGSNVRTGTHILEWSGTAQGKIGAGSFSATGVTGSLTGGSNTNIEFNTGTLTSVRLTPGSTSQPYIDIGDQQELFRCQRYCFRFSLVSSNSTVFLSEAVFASTTSGFVTGPFPQVMRTNPTLVAEGAANQYTVYDPVANAYSVNNSVPTANAVTSAQFYLFNFSIASGGTAGRRCYFASNAQQTNSIRFEAEL